MTVDTYERIAKLISDIKRAKASIKYNKERIDRSFESLNKLLIENGQTKIKLEDIEPSIDINKYYF